MLKYLLKYGGYKGKCPPLSVFKQMEEMKVCPGRSSQSMHSRFKKWTMKRLALHGVTEEQLIKADKKIYG